MKEKTKEFFKKYLIGFVLGMLSAGIVVVYAETYFPSNDVTYDNSTSGLQSKNVQDAIDELYGVCFPPSAGDQIIEDGGLEKDPYECRYFFTGANPNNYVTFNNEKAGWRIISVECDGTIKIMRNDNIGNLLWNSTNSTNWASPAWLNTYLNGTYLKDLSSEAQGQIVSHNWGIGAITSSGDDLAGQIKDENSTTWNGKIALPTVSEFLRATSNKTECGTLFLYNTNSISCYDTNWINDIDPYSELWTLSPYGKAVYVLGGKFASIGLMDVNGSGYADVAPVVYLSSDLTISGSGTESDPYTIE